MVIRTGTPDNPADMAGWLPDVPMHKVELVQQLSRWIETYQISGGIQNHQLQAFSMSEMVEMLMTFTTEDEDNKEITYHEWLGDDQEIENKYICQFTGWDPEDLVEAQKRANRKAHGTVQKIVLTVVFLIILVIVIATLMNMKKNVCSGDDCTKTVGERVNRLIEIFSKPFLERANEKGPPVNYRNHE